MKDTQIFQIITIDEASEITKEIFNKININIFKDNIIVIKTKLTESL